MKKNVLQFIGSFHQGGSERQAVQLSILLKDCDEYDIFVATLTKDGILLDEIERFGFTDIPEFGLTSFYNLSFLRQLWNCRNYLRQNNINIVHTHDFYTNVFGIIAARLAGVNVKIASKRETGDVRSNSQRLVEKWIFWLADSIVANSAAVRSYLTNDGVPAEKINVIYNGLDFGRVKSNNAPREEVCVRFGLPTDPGIKFVTHIANLRHKVKNQELLLRAALRLKEELPETHLIFAGEGERQPELESMARNLGLEDNAHFLGRCTAIPELLSISTVGVLVSTAEGFSNSILEYMAAGKPVVATDVGGAREAIAEGESGFLVNSGDERALALRLGTIISDESLADRFGKRGKAIIEEKFSLMNQLDRTKELYKKLVEK